MHSCMPIWGRVAAAHPWRLPSAVELWSAKASLDLVSVTDNYHGVPKQLTGNPEALCKGVFGSETSALFTYAPWPP